MGQFQAYELIIAGSIVIMLSFFFQGLSRKTSIPSVLMLILLGLVIQLGLKKLGIEELNLNSSLELLGIVGLIMIVLEAALELKLEREKTGLILRSLAAATVGLAFSVATAAAVIHHLFNEMDWLTSILYATPLSILSSAIIIPSVSELEERKKEFHIYESTFSDILGIMFFYFMIGLMDGQALTPGPSSFSIAEPLGQFGLSLIVTVIVSIVAGFVLIVTFQRISSGPKLFLLIAVLLLLYSIGKLMHLSPLIIILVFGLLVSNSSLFFRGRIASWLDEGKFRSMEHGLHIVTLETAFVVRTFFFVVFGMSIILSSLLNLKVVMVSMGILVTIYITRWVVLRVIEGPDLTPQVWIAPRGLISVLLFYAIPDLHSYEDFESGVLLFIILASGLIMTFGMVGSDGSKKYIMEPEVPLMDVFPDVVDEKNNPDEH